MKRMRDAYGKCKEGIGVIFQDIENAIKTNGLEWCERNRDKWVEESKTCGAKINWYGLFKFNHKGRFQSAVVKNEKPKEKVETVEEDAEEIPF